MTTKLKLVKDAYASMTVAVYQPLITTWISGLVVGTLTDLLIQRAVRSRFLKDLSKGPTIKGLTESTRDLRRERIKLSKDSLRPDRTTPPPIDLGGIGGRAGQPLIRAVTTGEGGASILVGDRVFRGGLDRAALAEIVGSLNLPGAAGDASFKGGGGVPIIVSGSAGRTTPDLKFDETKALIQKQLVGAIDASIGDTNSDLADKMAKALRAHDALPIFEFFPRNNFHLREALSPIGVAHFYRQLYFAVSEGVGPLEQAFTIAPNETLEVLYETIRKQTHEEFLELASEQVSEQAVESRDTSEVSDKVSSMVQRDISASMSAHASGSIGVWQAGASATSSFSTSAQSSRETATKKLREVTTRASERVRKSVTIQRRDVTETTSTTLNRRVIRNEANAPVSYGLRRVLRRVRVKVQDMGSALVWQTYLRDPGRGLARSRFVHFLDAAPIAPPDDLPGVPPRPTGGLDSGDSQAVIQGDPATNMWFVPLTIDAGLDRTVTAAQIDSIRDLEGGGKDNPEPSAANNLAYGQATDPVTGRFSVKIPVVPGDSTGVAISYSFRWEPSPKALAEWEAKRAKAVEAWQREQAEAEFERKKTLITEKSRIRTRAPAGLRLEERFEIMNRLVSHLFGRSEDASEPTPLEIENFYRYFDIDSLFFYTFPSWWRPRYSPSGTGLARPPYEITAESEPAPTGKSLGWLMQLDADDRRNHFLNSPWLRVCVPVRAGKERAAIRWLAEHLEGERGYDTAKDPLKSLLADIERRREREAALGISGPEFVGQDTTVVDATAIAPDAPLKPENIYPVVHEFEVTEPTEGFVYDKLEVDN